MQVHLHLSDVQSITSESHNIFNLFHRLHLFCKLASDPIITTCNNNNIKEIIQETKNVLGSFSRTLNHFSHTFCTSQDFLFAQYADMFH